MNQKDMELILQIYRVPGEGGYYNPAVVDVATHEITPLWVAATAYGVFAKYIDRLSEDIQAHFEREAIEQLKMMLEDGMNYITSEQLDD